MLDIIMCSSTDFQVLSNYLQAQQRGPLTGNVDYAKDRAEAEAKFGFPPSSRATTPVARAYIREDGTTAVFEFQRGEAYGKDSFPTLEVYGNTRGSELRLITCDGYNPETGEFDDNYVVYATLVP